MSIDSIYDPISANESYHFILSDKMFLQHDANKVSEETILALPQRNRLRRDNYQTIYYGADLFDIWICRLCSEQVICLSLFNGKRSIGEIANIISDISGCNYQSSLLKIRFFLYQINYCKSSTFVEYSNDLNIPVKTFNYEEYIHSENKLTLRLDAPALLIIMPTDKCLTDCEYCYACRKPVWGKNLLSLDRIFELIDEAHDIGVISINVDGGDIFARPEHMQILERMLSYTIEPSISTKYPLQQLRFLREVKNRG